MLKLKNSFITFFSLMAMIGAITALTPTTTRSQGGGGGSKDVNVVNTPTVNVGNVPTVNAQQGGAWSVGITGTPTGNLANNGVQVSNPATNPVPVRDVQITARQPVQVEATVNVDFGELYNDKIIYTVPDGKRLVVEFVSAEGDVEKSQFLTFEIATAYDDEFVIHTLASTRQGENVTSATYHASQLVRYYAQPLTNVIYRLRRSSSLSGNARGGVTLSGYLEDAL